MAGQIIPGQIIPGQIVLTGFIPYPDGTHIQYSLRPYLVVGVSSTHIETLIISSLFGKAHKLIYSSNFQLKNSMPPLAKASFVKLDSYQKTEITQLTDLRVVSNGQLIDSIELNTILSLYPTFNVK